jgi:hypothetical protein
MYENHWSLLRESMWSLTSPSVGRTSGAENFAHELEGTFSTWGNSGIEPDKGKGISSPGMHEASLMLALQRWRTAMEYYVGLDVSLRQTSICVVDQTGLVVREGVVDSDPEAISVYVRSKAPDAVRIGLETGPTSTWLWTELKRLGLPVICIDARHAKAVLKMQINKSDRNDAIGIGRIMQTGWFKEVHVKDIDSHSVRALLASRALLSRSSVISRTMSAAFSRTSVSSSAVPSSMSSPCEPRS